MPGCFLFNDNRQPPVFSDTPEVNLGFFLIELKDFHVPLRRVFRRAT